MVQISVIIPVYNTGEYLRNCLDSIINQTFKDIEIICINDGSTDNSLEILEEYQKSDSRIKIYSQENQGQGAARNNALKYVSGKYTYFMDSDDILELNALNDLYQIAEEKSLDMVIFKLINVDEETGEKYSDNYYEMSFLKQIVGEDVFNYGDVGENLYNIAVSPPGKLFKSDLISDIKFPENLIFEDNPFFIEAFFKSKRVYFYDKYFYNRLRRKDSVMTTNDSYVDVIPISNMVLDITKKYGHYDEFKNKVFNKKIFSTYYRFTLIDNSLKQNFFNQIKEDFHSFQDEINENIKLESLNKYIFQSALNFENYNDFEFSVKYFKKEFESNDTDNLRLSKCNEIARVDMKNFGVGTNDIVILKNSDINSKITFPKWFNNEKGKGKIIESKKGEINLKLKIVNNGRLRLVLRSIDLRDYGLESYVDYTSLIINGDEYLLNNHNVFTHDEPFVFNKQVKDSQIFDIHITWMTYDKINEYVDDINKQTQKNDRLTNNSFKLINKLTKLQKENEKLQKELEEVYSSNSWNITKPLRKIRN